MNQFYKSLSLWIVIVLMMIMLYNLFSEQKKTETIISYSEFIKMAEEERIKNVVIQGQKLFVTDSKKNTFKVYIPSDDEMIKILRKKGVNISVSPLSDVPWYQTLIVSWLPMLLLVGVWVFFMRNMQMGGKALSFGKSKARLMSDDKMKVTFKDVAGVDEAKDELQEIVEFLKEPQKFTKLGGRIPKGVLLVGPPGTGKTLLSRSIAGEADVPFFSMSGSDFVEMFVGVGASRVRDLFVQGKRHAPCIIFIDEIDAVGRNRGVGLGGGHDEREQTLNQLLVEMDGFESNEGVILISATNRPDVLDPALLRPGRFDRQVVVPMPDINGREQILEVYLKKTPLKNNVKARLIAKGTPGFSGADLENLVNEAALLAAKRGKKKISMPDLEEAKDKVYMGLARKSKVIKEEDKKATAYHEAGHALVARFLPFTDAVNKVTIIPRGMALGVTWYFPDESEHRYKDQLESQLAVALGGRAAEEIVLQKISTGASNDIEKATEIANNMVRTWGMSEKLGPLSYAKGDEQIFLGRELAQPKEYSEKTAQIIDEEISSIITGSHIKAREVLTQNVDILHQLSELLLEKETVSGRELDELILSMRPGFEFPTKGAYDLNEEEEEDLPDEDDEEEEKEEEVKKEKKTRFRSRKDKKEAE